MLFTMARFTPEVTERFTRQPLGEAVADLPPPPASRQLKGRKKVKNSPPPAPKPVTLHFILKYALARERPKRKT